MNRGFIAGTVGLLLASWAGAQDSYVVLDAATGRGLFQIDPVGNVTSLTPVVPWEHACSLARDKAGNYIITVDTSNAYGTMNGVYRASPDGTIVPVWIGEIRNRPRGIVVDGAGDYLVLDNDRLLRITPGGTMQVLFEGFPLREPTGLALDASGNCIIADAITCGYLYGSWTTMQAGAVFRFDPHTGVLTTVRSTIDEDEIVKPWDEWLGYYSGVAVDRDGNYILIEAPAGSPQPLGDTWITRMNPAGDILQSIFVGPVNGYVSVGLDVKVDSQGNYIVADGVGTANDTGRLLRVTPAGQVSTIIYTTLMGTPSGVVILPKIESPVALLTAQASPGNGGTVSGGGTFPVGSQQQISATANPGWSFSQWQDGNTQNPRTVTVPAGGATYAATFVQAPGIAVGPASLDFGSLQVGTTADRTLYVTNTGGGTLNGSASVNSPFSIVSGGSYTLGANQSQPVVVRYSPAAAGTNTAVVGLSGGSGASANVTGVAYESNPPSCSFTNATLITVNDAAAASPYPSSITVAGQAGTVRKATVILRGWTHSYPHDVGVLLVGPKGQKVVVMANSGGYGVNNVTLTFDDDAPTGLTEYPESPIATGSYKPSNCGTGDTAFPPGAPSGPYASTLTVCRGASPNGTWSLYVQDDLPGDSGTVVGGWTLILWLDVPPQPPQITTPPQNLRVIGGHSASFTVLACGTPPPSYQWLLNGTNLVEGGRMTGTTTANLVISNVQASDAGNYAVVVSNSGGAMTSSPPALLTVVPFWTPVLSAPAPLGNGQYQVTLWGAATTNYGIEISADLNAWKPLRAVTAPASGSTNVLDASTGLKQRFYRAKAQ